MPDWVKPWHGRFAKAGYAVLVADLDEQRARSVADDLGAGSGHLAMNVTDENGWQAALDRVKQDFQVGWMC